jgi:hypothetical protein
MGQQHNTHITNTTDDTIKVILTDTNARTSELKVASKGVICLPTPKGVNTINAYAKTKTETGQSVDKINEGYCG